MLPLNDNLKKRLLTIIVGAPIVIGILYIGGALFNVSLFIVMFIAMYEWFSMARKAKRKLSLSFFGFVYIVAGILAIYNLRAHEDGMMLVLMLLLCVWGSDILAYIFGKLIGGPKMSPTISPNKTWSGYVGALFGAVIPLSVFAFYVGEVSTTLFFVVLSVVIGVVGQSGDLVVSALKRHVGVKDTGALFPGHGGILDRIDALLLVAPVFYALTIAVEGFMR
jgi:phosphatidate cytidylyltransferase